MMCGRPTFSFSAFLLLVLLLLARTISAQPVNEPIPNLSAPNMPEPLPATTSRWQNFDQAWLSLKEELTASDEDWARLLTSLQNLQTEADELQLSLLESNRLLQLSDQALEVERQRVKDALAAREAAIMSATWWRAVASVSGVIAAVSLLIAIF